MDDDVSDLLGAWGSNVSQPGQFYGGRTPKLKSTPRRGEMKIAIERINNGWLVNLETVSGFHPHGSSVRNGRNFADTPEAICGIVAEWVLAECKRQEGTTR